MIIIMFYVFFIVMIFFILKSMNSDNENKYDNAENN